MRGSLAKKIRRFVKLNWESLPDKLPYTDKNGPTYKSVQFSIHQGSLIRIPGVPFKYAKECRRSLYKELKQSYKKHRDPAMITATNWN